MRVLPLMPSKAGQMCIRDSPNHPYHNVSKGTYPYFKAMKFPDLLKSVEKVDDNTVRITLNKKDATFLASLRCV